MPSHSDEGSGTAEASTVEPVESDVVAVDAVVVVDVVPAETVVTEGGAAGIATVN